MTLSVSALTSSLQAIFDGSADTSPADGNPDGTPATPTDAANALAHAYAQYAAAATFGASVPMFSAQESALASALLPTLAVPGLGAAHAAAWAAGLVAFWTGVPVVGAQAGATVGCPGAAAVTATLTALFVDLTQTAATSAPIFAAALHTATLTVTASVAPPPGTVLPIT